jgi:hypothetical protein
MSPVQWGLLAGITGLAGYVPYLRDAWLRRSDPDPAAWLIWTVEYCVLLAAQAAQHPPWGALCLAALQLVGTGAVLAVLTARGGWRFGAGRWALLGCAGAVMTVWWFTDAPGTAMCLALAVEGAGMVLVMAGVYRNPGSETLLTWQAFTLAGLLDLPALGSHAPRLLYAYPAFFVAMGAGVLVAAALGARAARSPRPERYLLPDPVRLRRRLTAASRAQAGVRALPLPEQAGLPTQAERRTPFPADTRMPFLAERPAPHTAERVMEPGEPGRQRARLCPAPHFGEVTLSVPGRTVGIAGQ